MTFQKLVVMLLKLAQIKKESKEPNNIHSTENFQTDQTLSFHPHNLCLNFDNLTLRAFSSTLFQPNFTLLIILIEILLSKTAF